jgi:Nitrate and nitrite sensing
MPQMVGNLSIRPKMVALPAVPVAGTVLLGAAGRDERARAAGDRRLAAVAVQAAAAVHELQEERARAVAWTAGSGPGSGPGGGDGLGGGRGPGEDGLAARRGRVDRALAAYRAATARPAPPATRRWTGPWPWPPPGWPGCR